MSSVNNWLNRAALNLRRSGAPSGVRQRRRLSLESLEQRALLAAGIETPSSLPEDTTSRFISRIITPQTPTNSTASQFPAVGMVGDTRGSFCSGTLISTEYVLTAAHCAVGVANTSGRFVVGGQTYGTSQVIVHPNYNESRLGTDTANDIALYRLNRPVTGVTPSLVYRQAPQVGQTLTLVGFGGARNSTGGSDGSFGTKRVGTTPLERVSSTIIGWTYDNLTESNTAPGDSGGPSYVQVGGVYYVAGVTSGGEREDAGIGDRSFNTRVDAYLNWIDSYVTSTPVTPITPTPSLPVISITATDASAAETRSTQTANQGAFTLTRTGSLTASLTVRLTVSGTAGNGIDYSTIASTVTFAAGSATASVVVRPTDDSLSESPETVIVSVATSTGYALSSTASSATVSIADNDTVQSNDAFANRQRLTGSNITATGNNLTATRETGEPNVAGVSGGKSIWYTWTAPASGSFSISTAGSSFDTTLGVYTGTAVSRLTRVAINDDEQLSTGILTSRVTMNATQGTTYQILVDGYQGASGNVVLAISQGTSRQVVASSSDVSRVGSRLATLPAVDATFAQFAQSQRSTTVPVAANAVRDSVFTLLRMFR